MYTVHVDTKFYNIVLCIFTYLILHICMNAYFDELNFTLLVTVVEGICVQIRIISKQCHRHTLLHFMHHGAAYQLMRHQYLVILIKYSLVNITIICLNELSASLHTDPH